jgi:methionyl aminopeptidase
MLVYRELITMSAQDSLVKAGRIASQVREESKSIVEVGKPVIEICEYVKGRVGELGGGLAFPCNVDIDHVAAHYTSPLGDMTVVEEGSLVKVDIGVHIDGYIADTATTICLDPSLKGLVNATEAGLDEAIKTVRAGARSNDIGAIIERTIKSRGAIPIRNLTGHRMARYVVHAGQSIPNVSASNGHTLREGEVYAIEPFSVPPTASGMVTDGPTGHIYLFKKKRRVRSETAKRMLRIIQSEYRTMPFASRWIQGMFPGQEGVQAFSELLRSKCIYSYPQLVERSHAPVAQAEHTVIVTEDGCIVTTA